MVETKVWWKSKTKWFNILSTALLVLSMPEIVGVLPESLIPWLALTTALGNFWLRSITNTGITLSDD